MARRLLVPTGGAAADAVYFLHIPKTGGRTLARYLASGFAPEDVCPAGSWPALLELPPDRLADYRLFQGHFGALLLDLLPGRPALVTMLRHPVQQTVSGWRYVQRHPAHPQHAEVMGQGPNLAAFVRSRHGNIQARHLAADGAPPELLERMRSTASRPGAANILFDDWTAQQTELLERASARLAGCLAFGLVERFDESVQLVAASLGWAPPSGVATLNAAPAWQPPCEPSVLEVELIQERNAIDVELYQRARRLFDRRWASVQEARPGIVYERRLRQAARPLDEELVVDMRGPFCGTGWLPAEQTARGWVRWMGPGGEATIDLPVAPLAGAIVEVSCAAVMTPALVSSWTLDINGEAVALSRAPGPNGSVLYSGVVPGHAATALGFTRLVFRVPETVAWDISEPNLDGSLDLGIAVRAVRLAPRQRASLLPAPSPSARETAERLLVAAHTLRATKPARRRLDARFVAARSAR